jgi:hypothetical protein
MAEGSNSSTATPSADAAARLYPSNGGDQSHDTTAPGDGSAEPASPYVVTNMTNGKTVYFDPNTGDSFEMETQNAISKKSKAGADSPYTGRIMDVVYPDSEEDKRKFGWAKITTDDQRQRWIHGGGSDLQDPNAPRQGWEHTRGCTRGQNEDVFNLAQRIEKFQQDHPDTPILYYRVRPEGSK